MSESNKHATGSIAAPLASSEFPHPNDFMGHTPITEPKLYAKAPWYLAGSFKDESLISAYVTAGQLPDGLPMTAIQSDDWARRIAIPDNALLRRRKRAAREGVGRKTPLAEARAAFIRTAFMRMRRSPCRELIPVEYGLDQWSYRTTGEARYGEVLCSILQMSKDWTDDWRPDQSLLGFTRPLLRAEFRFMRRHDSDFWRQLKWERRFRSRSGFLVPYQMVEVEMIREESREGRYVRIPSHFREWEVPKGFGADLPPVLTYAGSRLIDSPSSGVWAVFYTEWVAKVACALLWECYDSLRLFWVSPQMRHYMKAINLSRVLGSPQNYEDLLSLLEVIEETDWASVPIANRCGGEGSRIDQSPGKAGNSGDYILWSPWTRNTVDADEVADHRRNRDPIPSGHRRGYVYADYRDISGLYPHGADDDYVEEEAEGPTEGPSAPQTSEAMDVDREQDRSVPAGTSRSDARSVIVELLQSSGVNFPANASEQELRALLVTKVTGQAPATAPATGASSEQLPSRESVPSTEVPVDLAKSSPKNGQAPGSAKAGPSATPPKGD